ncbi:MAG TPA: hypothetical protein PK562_02505 [Candidatus Omnitrophota bacterium]|nr:hypothetical protein [Candidatus Omnitrophota bacterium]
MRHLTAAFVIVLLAAGSLYAVDSGSLPASQQPVVKEKIGSGDIHLEAAKYPEFTDIAPSAADPGCMPDNPTVFNYLAGKDIKTKSNSPYLREFDGNTNPDVRKRLVPNPKRVVTVEPWPTGRILDESLLGVQKTDLFITLGADEINPKYRDTAKILVTWTMRIEGECPNWHIGHFICEPYNGSITFVCPAGNVKTRLRAEYEWTDEKGKHTGESKIGHDVIMEMPRTIQKSLQGDPTLTGTYVITREDFPNKKIPDKLTLRVYWENDTALYITSPAGMRNMIVNVIPFTKASK